VWGVGCMRTLGYTVGPRPQGRRSSSLCGLWWPTVHWNAKNSFAGPTDSGTDSERVLVAGC
jgi:hypothetical protein